jgi:tetratricopeptide (TPR) repeat protein
LDDLATRAERAFYAELANGRRTRDAVRAARAEMRQAQAGGPMAFAWAQMVLYHHGADYPLGTRIEGPGFVAIETTERRAETAYPNSRTRVLKAGFVGRRKEMHALRRDLRQGRHLHVVQGTGGLGKSAFCAEALKVYDRLGWQPVALWCLDVENAANPVAGLVSQIEAAGNALCGDKWRGVLAEYEGAAANDEKLRASSVHLLSLLQGLLASTGRSLVLYLDNLESLQMGPAEADPEEFAEWRHDECARFWTGLLVLQRENPARLAVLASSRYRHRDFGAVVPFDSLPADALWRMLLWFPSLRRLSEQNRAWLIERLAGHPRAVEYLDALIEEAIRHWESENGPFVPGCLTPDNEQTTIIRQALPGLDAKLSENLLFDALWDRVLDGPSRELIVRTSVLRRPGDRGLLAAFAGGGRDEAISRLIKTGLLTEIREPRSEGGWILTYRIHPTISRLAAARCERSDDIRREGHQRAGDYLEQAARSSPSWEDNVEAAYHLREVGEVDRAFDLIAPLIEWLQARGRIQDSLFALAEIGDPDSLDANRAAWVRTFSGDAAQTYGDLPEALNAHRAGLAIRERLAAADPSNAGWQRDLSVSQNKVGDVLSAQGRLDDALSAYRASLAIAERLAAADASNAGWQRDLSVSQEKLGSVLSAQGRLDDALSAYHASLAISERLAAADASNAGWQRDLSVSQDRVGNVLSAQGRLDDALSAYRAGLGMRERLAEADASKAGWQRDLFASYAKLGSVEEKKQNPKGAALPYAEAAKIIRRLAPRDPSNVQWQRDLAWIEERLATVSAASTSDDPQKPGGWSALWSWLKR